LASGNTAARAQLVTTYGFSAGEISILTSAYTGIRSTTHLEVETLSRTLQNEKARGVSTTLTALTDGERRYQTDTSVTIDRHTSASLSDLAKGKKISSANLEGALAYDISKLTINNDLEWSMNEIASTSRIPSLSHLYYENATFWDDLTRKSQRAVIHQDLLQKALTGDATGLAYAENFKIASRSNISTPEGRKKVEAEINRVKRVLQKLSDFDEVILKSGSVGFDYKKRDGSGYVDSNSVINKNDVYDASGNLIAHKGSWSVDIGKADIRSSMMKSGYAKPNAGDARAEFAVMMQAMRIGGRVNL
jgi:hypothetical protein